MTLLDAQTNASLRRKHIRTLADAWCKSEQAEGIKRTMGSVVLAFCRMEAEAIAHRRKPDERGAIVLTRDQIKVCGERAISSARVAAYGPWALNDRDGGARWKQEYAAARAIILTGVMPPRLGDAHSEASSIDSVVAPPMTAPHPSRLALEDQTV